MIGSVATEEISIISTLLNGRALFNFPEIITFFLEQEIMNMDKTNSRKYFFIKIYFINYSNLHHRNHQHSQIRNHLHHHNYHHQIQN